jgi:hypothetical protein
MHATALPLRNGAVLLLWTRHRVPGAAGASTGEHFLDALGADPRVDEEAQEAFSGGIDLALAGNPAARCTGVHAEELSLLTSPRSLSAPSDSTRTSAMP